MQNYTETELEFREKWISKALRSLGFDKCDETYSKLKKMFDDKFQKTTIELQNTETAEVHNIPADKFFLSSRKKFILNENGTLTWKHAIKLSVIVPIILNSIRIRQIKKKAKVKAIADGDGIMAPIFANEESALKIIINGLI